MATRIVNPFYKLLMVAGTLFALTAIPYWLMCLRQSDASAAWMYAGNPAEVAGEPLTRAVGASLDTWMQRYGMTTLMVELAVLGVATAGALGTDEFWERRAALRAARGPASPEGPT